MAAHFAAHDERAEVDETERMYRRAAQVRDKWGIEDTDSSWTDTASSAIEAAVRDNSIDVVVSDVACRTTLCRVKLQTGSLQEGQRLLEALASGDEDVFVELDPESQGQPSEERGLTVYVGRAGEYFSSEPNLVSALPTGFTEEQSAP